MKNRFKINSIALAVLLLCFAMNWGIAYAANSVFTTASSNTPEIVLLNPSNTNSMAAAWLPVTMNVPANQVAYEIHVSRIKKFVPSTSTLHHTVIGKSQTTLTRLKAGRTYYVLVIANDQQGNVIKGTKYSSATTFKSPLIFNPTTPLTTSNMLKLGNHRLSGDTLIFNKTANSQTPAVNSVLVSHNSNGGYLLRHVDNVTTSATQINVTTSQASLSDALDQATVSSQMKLFDVGSTTANSPMMQAKRLAQTNGNRYSKMSWDNELITAEQTEYAYRGKQLSITPKNVAGQYAIGLRKSAATVSEEVSLNAAVSFTPTLDTGLSWSQYGAIESGRLIATGTLSLDASAVYNFQAAGSYNPAATTLFTRPFTSVYLVGGIPVYQEVTLTVKAQISATANAQIKASTHANIAETVSIGVTYNPTTQQWQPVFNQAERKSFTAHLNINGGVQAEIRLIPEITVKFYSIATLAGVLSLEPHFNANVEAKEISSNPTVLAAIAPRVLQPTQFDVDLSWDGYVSANMSMLWHNISLYPRTKISGTTTHLFTLSTLKIPEDIGSMAAGETKNLTLQVSNGIHDNFNPNSVLWEAIPNGLANITNQGCTANNTGFDCHASLTVVNQGNYQVLVSGFGALGEMGRQYAKPGCQIGAIGSAGGIIFYFNDATCVHGLEAAPIDQTPSLWGCSSYDSVKGLTCATVGGTSTAVGTGAANTAAIIAACPSGSAAAIAAAYTLNGYSDWYLPSHDELNLIYTNLGQGALALPTNVEGFASNDYWSSSEFDYFPCSAWDKYFGNGSQVPYGKNSTLYVRAVRAF